MKLSVLVVLGAAAALSAHGLDGQVVRPFESKAGFEAKNTIDTLVLASLKKQGIEPANECSDEVFIRRAFIDVIGTLPEAFEVRGFLLDTRPDKRSALIDRLLERQEFADYWSLKWCDVLRVKAEFPINLWPNAVQAYHRWIRDAIRDNKPYDQFARELLTSSGSNFRVPPVNFYRAVQGHEPPVLAAAVALTFMGTHIEKWPEAQRTGMTAFFSRVTFKKTSEWKEEIVCLNPAPAGALDAVFPDGSKVQIPADEDPRQVFADWLISAKNPWFARNAVNRVWAWLMGRGIINEPDDIRPDNPAVNPELLSYLEKELVKSKYDLRHIYRLILNSATYQQSSIPKSDKPEAVTNFACYSVRRLDAEVLIDALCKLTGSTAEYSSPIPEPFTFIPESERTIDLADGSISSSYLETFGRPTRDTGMVSERNNEPSDDQRLYLLNSSDVQRRIARSERMARLMNYTRGKPDELIRALYLGILSRDPTEAETVAANKYLKTGGVNPKQGGEDLAWALINSKEFLYRH